MKRKEKYLLLKKEMREDTRVRRIYLEKEGVEVTLVTNSEYVISEKEKVVDYIVQFRSCSVKTVKDNIYKAFSKRMRKKLKLIVKTTPDRKKWSILMRYGTISPKKRRSPR